MKKLIIYLLSISIIVTSFSFSKKEVFANTNATTLVTEPIFDSLVLPSNEFGYYCEGLFGGVIGDKVVYIDENGNKKIELDINKVFKKENLDSLITELKGQILRSEKYSGLPDEAVNYGSIISVTPFSNGFSLIALNSGGIEDRPGIEELSCIDKLGNVVFNLERYIDGNAIGSVKSQVKDGFFVLENNGFTDYFVDTTGKATEIGESVKHA